MSQDLYPVLAHSQNCLSLEFTSSNRPKSPTYKAFQTSGAPGFASTLSSHRPRSHSISSYGPSTASLCVSAVTVTVTQGKPSCCLCG
ncbi:hypothetical protein FIBSPDRAFT_877267 [Athelia psychrophila]|uniref:Uncharacterized protein n=1 Tax=Athelia psychrophila TaxID=1759441 RepID=A0A167W3R4_9AGAM|nr:hypothetical protein FIBSPDRAFT_877267 [Fibularhizoctonia sp. CBS 109695]